MVCQTSDSDLSTINIGLFRRAAFDSSGDMMERTSPCQTLEVVSTCLELYRDGQLTPYSQIRWTTVAAGAQARCRNMVRHDAMVIKSMDNTPLYYVAIGEHPVLG